MEAHIEERSTGGGQAQLHGYASDMPNGDMIFSISLDNTVGNTKAMNFLKEHPSINLLLSDFLSCVRCCAHIFILCVQERIAELQPLYRHVLTNLHNESRLDPHLLINNEHWSLAMGIHYVLASFNSPNIHMVILECMKITNSINQVDEGNPSNTVCNVLSSMKVKWYGYFKDFPYIYGIGAILDLVVKTDAIIQPEFVESSSKVWKNHSLKFLVLVRIAKDILAISASTIASESAFSAGRRVFDEKRSRLTPQSIEMC
ncbi:putative AC9 transposase, partial [Bienertia sinuspersici]